MNTTTKCREVRFGLVMYGGVSLAIYINGVAHEFFRAVRGRGVYRLIKALTDSDIIVDVISGTSAGGINGVLLSYALCNEREFGEAATLWREHGDIAKLLRAPNDPNAISFLNSEGFYQPKLEEVFSKMSQAPCRTDEPEDLSTFSELDLFVTGTDVDGTPSTVFDDAGHPIDIKNHRSVFILSHRKDRKEPFKYSGNGRGRGHDVTIQALAKLSRVTSCFPAAFAPVHVSLGENEPPDALLQEWGKLGKDSCFLDGGVLDNKPFTYTIKSIFSRCADREVERKLFYVEPDPECFQQRDLASSPTILQSVLAALIGIPGYESISDDLELLAARNSKLQRYARMLNGFSADCSEPSAESKALYIRSRLVAISERVVRGILRKGVDAFIDPAKKDRAAELVRQFDENPADESTLKQFDVDFRIRRVMRVTYLIHDQNCTDSAPHDLQEKHRALWRALNNQFQLYEILRSVMERVIDDALIDWEKLSAKDVWRCAEAALLRLLDGEGKTAEHFSQERLDRTLSGGETWLDEKVLKAVNATLRDEVTAIVEDFKKGTFDPGKVKVENTLLKQLDHCEKALIEHFADASPLHQAWESFEKIDTYLFPLEMVGDLHEKDVIDTIRISPRDAQRGFSKAGFSDKVAGDALYHFGGFFKRSWRSNDILWGRLDALCQLVETLLTRERLAKIVGTDYWRAQIQSRFFAQGGTDFQPALAPANLFPKSGNKTAEIIEQWLRQLLSDDAAKRAEALEEKAFEEKLNLIVEAAQLEVIAEDLPNVLMDAISEQAEWNQFKVSETPTGAEAKKQLQESLAASPFTFRHTKAMFDPLFASIAAAERVKLAMETFDEGKSVTGGGATRPSDTRLGRFFASNYKVGTEKLMRDVPPAVLLELVAHALLITRNCVLKLLEPQAVNRLQSHPLGKLLDWSLSGFYALAVVSRRSPPWTLTLITVPMFVCLTALAIAAIWHKPLLWASGEIQWYGIGFLVVLPILFILIECLLLKQFVRRAHT